MKCSSVSWLMLAAVAVCAQAQTPVGELTAPDARVQGAVMMAGGNTMVASGSTVTAGASTAAVQLRRGGQVRICPHAALTLSASSNGRQMMFSLGTGAIEMHYRLSDSADTVQTPDFRILLAGPGEFHFAVAADAHGNTCVRTLPTNTASLIVNEVLGDGTYQVKPQEQVVFANGTVKDASTAIPPDCGCPAETVPKMLAQPIPFFETPKPRPQPASAAKPQAPAENDVHVSVDAPFVFRATEPTPAAAAPVIARLQLKSLPQPLLMPVVQPPPAPVAQKPAPAAKAKPDKSAKKQGGFFGRIRSFFGGIFH